MFISASSPTRSIRFHPEAGRELVLVGGEGHPVGRGGPTGPATTAWRASSRALRLRPGHPPLVGAGQLCGRRRAARRKADATSRHTWVATGFRKWGLAMGAAAAQLITDAIAGRENPLAGVFRLDQTDAGRLRQDARHPERRHGPPLRRRPSHPQGRGHRRGPRAPAKDGSPPGTAARSRSPAATTARFTPCRHAVPTWAASSPGTTPSRPGTAHATRPASLRTDLSCKVLPCTRWLSGSRSAGARAWQERAVSEWGLLLERPLELGALLVPASAFGRVEILGLASQLREWVAGDRLVLAHWSRGADTRAVANQSSRLSARRTGRHRFVRPDVPQHGIWFVRSGPSIRNCISSSAGPAWSSGEPPDTGRDGVQSSGALEVSRRVPASGNL